MGTESEWTIFCAFTIEEAVVASTIEGVSAGRSLVLVVIPGPDGGHQSLKEDTR